VTPWLGGRTEYESDNVLPYPDQALFLALRGAGQEAVMQVLWIYEHPLDMDGLRRFHRNFGRGLLARRIETSPLPFGRHRWVASGPPPEIEIDEMPRERSDLYSWADEQVDDRPLDPEQGPGWRIGVQSFSDGSTAVSLVVSHCIADGGAVVIALLEAINGQPRDLGYPQPRSRTRWGAARADLRQLRYDWPEIRQTVRKAVTVGRRRRKDITARRPASPLRPGASDLAHVPSTTVVVDVEEWDRRAENLGGNSFSLVAAFVAKIAQHLGRMRASDGRVTLIIPVNDREDFADTGGNVVALANVCVDPALVTADLTPARSAIRDALKRAREAPDEMVELLPLIPFLPKRAMAPMADAAFGFSTDLPVSCSNMGDLPTEVNRLDGTAADYVCFRGVDRRVRRDTLERRHGLLTVASGRVGGKIINTVISYQPGADNSTSHLREVVGSTLVEFGLAGEIL
jgi:hypothetical protein